jgi:ribosomal protein L22
MADDRDTPETPEPDAPETAEADEAAAAAAPAEEPKAEAAEEPTAEADAEPEAAEDDEPAEQPAAEAKPRAARRRARRAAAAEDQPAKEERPARKRAAGDGAPVVVRAQAKYVRSSARKARLVCDHIRGKTVEEARSILAFTPRAVARDWSKLLESAVANAEHNHELDGDDLVIKAAHADEGPTLKRFRPRAMGRATPIRKRTSHLTILLTTKE